VKESEIDAKPVVVKPKPPLTINQGRIVAQLRKKSAKCQKCTSFRTGSEGSGGGALFTFV
jgi:hypothetical protein